MKMQEEEVEEVLASIQNKCENARRCHLYFIQCLLSRWPVAEKFELRVQVNVLPEPPEST